MASAPPIPPIMPGQQPTPAQIQIMQQQIAAEAQKRGMSVPQFVEQLKAQAARQQAQMMAAQQQAMAQQQGGPPPTPEQMAQHQAAMQQMQAQRNAQMAQMQRQQQMQGQQQQQQQGQQVPIQPGPPKPEALAVANFLKSQDLKSRTCIFQEKRKDMFKVKRALRALQSAAYEKARKKNPLLPPVSDRDTAEQVFKLLPLSLLALRVSKIDSAHQHAGQQKKQKRVKGLWTVKIEQQQDAGDMLYYMWMYEGSQWKQRLYAVGTLAAIMAVVMFPLWPMFLRQGVWYLSMGVLGLLGLFFAMAIFRLILFIVTMFTHPPGLWLYPNLFEDVGFFDSFRPLWAWHETEEQKKVARREKKVAKTEKRAARAAEQNTTAAAAAAAAAQQPAPSAAQAEASASPEPEMHASGTVTDNDPVAVAPRRDLSARVEEVEDE